MKYKVLVLDIDGTLTDNNKNLPKENQLALLAAQEKGLTVVLASGRPPFGIAPIANALQLSQHGGYILAFNGGQIKDCRSGEIIAERTLPTDILPLIYNDAKQNGMEILTYENDNIITENPENPFVQKEAFLNKMKAVQVENLVSHVQFSIPKCLIVGEAEQLALLETKMQKQYNGRVNIFRSEPYFLEIVPIGIDKAQSLQTLLDHLHLGQTDMAAIGDGFNDLSMICFASLGIAMNNAQPEVKAVAQQITLSNEECGVAYAIKNFIL